MNHIRPKMRPCLSTDRHRSRLHVALVVPGYVTTLGCGLQFRDFAEEGPGFTWCDTCWRVFHGQQKPASNHMDDCRADGGRKSRMAAAAQRQRREGDGRTPEVMDALVVQMDWDGE